MKSHAERLGRKKAGRRTSLSWLFAGALASALGPASSGARELPVDEDPCSFDPAYVTWRESCREAVDSRRRDACAWGPVLDYVVAGRGVEAEAALGEAFDLPAEQRSILLDAATLFLPLLLASPSCLAEETPGLMKRFQELMKGQVLRGKEAFELLGRLCELDDRVLAKISSRESDDSVRRGVERAARGYAELFAGSVGLGRVRWMLARMPMVGRHPGLYPAMRVWDPSLRDVAPHLEALDRALEVSVESTEPAERFRRLAAAIEAMPSDRSKAFAWTRAGVGLLLLGRPIEAWTALAWAEDRYRRLDRDPDPLTGFGRDLARYHQLAAAIQLELMPEVFRLLAELEASDSALENRVSEVLMRILSGDPKHALRTSIEIFEDEPLAEAEQELFLLGLEIMLPGLAGSSEAVSLAEQAMESSVSSEAQPSSLTAVPEALVLHGIEVALEEWRFFARLAPHWQQVLWPASLMRQAWNEDGDAYLVRRVIAVIVDYYEQDLDPLWADELVRAALDSRVSRFYPAAFELSIDAGGPPEESFAYAERARAYSLRRLLGLPPDAATRASHSEIELEAEIVRMVHDGVTASRLGETRDRFASARLERKLLDIETELPDFPEPVDLATLQEEILLEHETLLAYFPGLERMHVWVVRRDGHWRRRVDWPLAELDQVAAQVDATRWVGASPEACRLRGVELCPASGAAASEAWLYERLVAPVADLLTRPDEPVTPGESGEAKPPGRLIVVPYGDLHRVPWAALRTPDGGRLIEEHELAVVPSADVLAALRRRQPVRDAAPMVPALVLGDPVLDHPEPSAIASTLPPLPGARLEARKVAQALDVEPLLGEQATEAALLDRARDARVLHIAAHGIYESKHPLFSRLHLAAGGGQDGFLHTYEIWDRLQLCQARLVVLSACGSAAGVQSGGDDLIGLTQAFLVAGAPAVVSTLWPVDDPASAALMTSFYGHFQAGATVGAALRLAQIELLRIDESAAPHFWAGYLVVGDAETRWHAEDETR